MKQATLIPWGHSLSEYSLMFNLHDTDLDRAILACSDGASSFNTELSILGGEVVSTDGIYQFSGTEIKSQITSAIPATLANLETNKDHYEWALFRNASDVKKARMAALEKFLLDYDLGVQQKRYVGASLPILPFAANNFELALCSHHLFLYPDKADYDKHLASIRELCRVAQEVRIYPLVTIDGVESPFLSDIIKALQKDGLDVETEEVKYQFHKNADRMLKILS